MLEVTGLTIAFEGENGQEVRVVDEVDFSLEPGKTLGLVGESGGG